MTNWPETIPHDLHIALEAARTDNWQIAFRRWSKGHGLKLKIQWYRGLHVNMSELHERRADATPQDHWVVLRDWLCRHDVPVSKYLAEFSQPE